MQEACQLANLRAIDEQTKVNCGFAAVEAIRTLAAQVAASLGQPGYYKYPPVRQEWCANCVSEPSDGQFGSGPCAAGVWTLFLVHKRSLGQCLLE